MCHWDFTLECDMKVWSQVGCCLLWGWVLYKEMVVRRVEASVQWLEVLRRKIDYGIRF